MRNKKKTITLAEYRRHQARRRSEAPQPALQVPKHDPDSECVLTKTGRAIAASTFVAMLNMPLVVHIFRTGLRHWDWDDALDCIQVVGLGSVTIWTCLFALLTGVTHTWLKSWTWKAVAASLWRCAGRVLTGALWGAGIGLAIRFAQSLGPPPVAMTPTWILACATLGSFVNLLVIPQIPASPCPQCGHSRSVRVDYWPGRKHKYVRKCSKCNYRSRIEN